MHIDDNQNPFSLVADFEGDESSVFDVEMEATLPILPLRNMVLFPGVVMPVAVGRKSSLRLAKAADKNKLNIGVVCQLSPETENPGFDDLYHIGTMAKIIRILELPDRSTTVILQGMSRFDLKGIVSDQPYLTGMVEKLEDTLPSKNNKEFEILVEACRERTMQYIQMSDQMPKESMFAVKNVSNNMFLVNFVCANFPFPIVRKMELLREGALDLRTVNLLKLLNKEIQYSELRAEIQRKTREDLDMQQREYFLQQQIKNIQDELGGTPQDQDLHDLRMQAQKKKWPEDVAKTFHREVDKLERLNPQSPDYNVQLNYLQTMLSLPWQTYTEDNLSLKNAERVLNKDHYGLEKVKERILEHLAVLQLRGDRKSPIICLYGPPGVGKTSLGKSIASALKRKYIRMSLGGLHDEAEIRGHRRTYIGAMPGRIIKSMIKAGSSNPVFILDEIDKVTQNTVNGDPSSALLEVLDPEQNSAFHDNFLDVDYDLSKVMFIATANNIGTIPRPLLDRMELIEVGGYITEEKVEIARRHLLPKAKADMGLDADNSPKVGKEALEFIIERYTRESGVRSLERELGRLCRKAAMAFATTDVKRISITAENVESYLGTPRYTRDEAAKTDLVGVVNGLAWTQVGGEILPVEVGVMDGSGKLELTGNLGEVMQESCKAAMSCLRQRAAELGIPTDFYKTKDIHIHFPEGAVPKDGPSAGIAITTALLSALTDRPVRHDVAMTGEVTLRGRVMPIGGLREKTMGALRAGIRTVILPKENEKDLDEIDPNVRAKLRFVPVETVDAVFAEALVYPEAASAARLDTVLPGAVEGGKLPALRV